jgi:hypothetical protein
MKAFCFFKEGYFFLCRFFRNRFLRLCLAIFERFLFFPLGIISPKIFCIQRYIRVSGVM